MRPPVAPSAMLAALVLTGCSVLVGSSELAPCDSSGGEPCPPGQLCQDGFCVATGVDAGCEPTEELCNGIDDDCDGVVDEGHDVDGDGLTWCGGGRLEFGDCDDNDVTVFPPIPDVGTGGTETCDGKDNDCDGMIDEDPITGPICAGGFVCVLGTGCVQENCSLAGFECPTGESCNLALSPPTCVPGRCTVGSCGGGEICDEVSGSCVVQRPPGSSCAADVECDSGSCTPTEALRLTGVGSQICTQACCGDADCAAGSVCWSAGSGARSCLPAEMVTGNAGSASALASCSSGADCRSGVCVDNECIATCGHDRDCPGSSCGVYSYDRPGVGLLVELACEAGSSGDYGDTCSDGFDCHVTLCNDRFLGTGFCSGACGTSADCPDLLGGLLEYFCGYAVGNMDRDFLQVCRSELSGAGGGRTGASCGRDLDCADNRCVGGTCADTCCNSSSCTGDTICRPVLSGSRWEMHCLPSTG